MRRRETSEFQAAIDVGMSASVVCARDRIDTTLLILRNLLDWMASDDVLVACDALHVDAHATKEAR